MKTLIFRLKPAVDRKYLVLLAGFLLAMISRPSGWKSFHPLS